MTVFVGLVFVCVAGYNLIKKKRGKSLAALGMFSVMMGFWRLTDTRFTPGDRLSAQFFFSVCIKSVTHANIEASPPDINICLQKESYAY